MSETSTLISCTGKITRAELAQMPTPPATNTHIPIPHIGVVECFPDPMSSNAASGGVQVPWPPFQSCEGAVGRPGLATSEPL